MGTASQEIEIYRERARQAEDKIQALREVLLDVDALLNLNTRERMVVAMRLTRDERSISRRVQDILLDTAETHCRNWAYGCDLNGCSCACSRCPAGATGKSRRTA